MACNNVKEENTTDIVPKYRGSGTAKQYKCYVLWYHSVMNAYFISNDFSFLLNKNPTNYCDIEKWEKYNKLVTIILKWCSHFSSLPYRSVIYVTFQNITKNNIQNFNKKFKIKTSLFIRKTSAIQYFLKIQYSDTIQYKIVFF